MRLTKLMTTFRLRCLVLTVMLGMSCFYSEAATNPARPNIILILTDDQGYNDLGCFGSDRIKTPNIDRMAAEGMRFTDFYATAPICTPTRASIMTGCYPSRVGLGTPLHTPDTIGMHADEITLAELLKSRGYATACIGKWHLGHHPQFYPTRHGFDHYYGTPMGHCLKTEMMRKRGDYSDLFLRDEESVPFPPFEELTRTLTEEAVNWIRANKQNPFFLFLSHPMPHGPVAASERFQGKSKGGPYGDAVEEIDWSTGEILKTIEEQGLVEDTIVVFTSDNGACTNPWGVDAKWFGSNAPFRGKKQQCWEGGVRVPCVMWGPGRIPAGTTCDELTTVMDFLPTFSAMAGADVPTDRVIDGKNIQPLMTGQRGAKSPYAEFVFHARHGKRSGIRVGDWKLLVPTSATTWTHKGTALYDLKRDEGEKHNVAAQHPEKVKELKARLAAFNKELARTARPAGSLEAPAVGDGVQGDWDRTDPLSAIYLPTLSSKNDRCNQQVVGIVTKAGSYLVTWTMASEEGKPDQRVAISRSTDAGQTWSGARIVAGDSPAHPGPASYSWLFQVPDTGRIYCFYLKNDPSVITVRRDITGWLNWQYSDDDGLTWNHVEARFDMGRGEWTSTDPAVPTSFIGIYAPHTTSWGDVLFSFARYGLQTMGQRKYDNWMTEVYFMRLDNILTESDPEKLTFSILPDAARGLRIKRSNGMFWGNEPAWIELSDGRLMTAIRSRNDAVYYALSSDRGNTWSEPAPLRYADGGDIVGNPNAPCPMIRLHDGRIVLMFYNTKQSSTFGPRNPVWISMGKEDLDAVQPIRLAEPKKFMEVDGRPPLGTTHAQIASYSTFAEHDGRLLLFYNDSKHWVLFKHVPDYFLGEEK